MSDMDIDRETARDDRRIERLLSGAVLILLIAGCVVVLWPFKTALLWAVVLTFTTWPVYQRLLRAMGGRRTWAALVMTLALTMVLLLPFAIVGFTLADNVKELSGGVRQAFEAGPPEAPAWVARMPLVGPILSSYWNRFAGDGRAALVELQRVVEPAGDLILSGGLAIGHGIVDLTVSILIAFFLYRDGAGAAKRVKVAAERLGGQRGHHLLELAGNTVRGVVYGILGTALVQGVMAGVGFLIARVPGAVVLALLTFFLAILPMGPPLIWGPVTAWLFYRGQIGWGIFMLVWGLLISSVDNVIKPWLISKGSDMPFLLIFFGVIGGALAFGFIGVFLGPTLLAVGYRLLQEWAPPPEPPLPPPSVVETSLVVSPSAEQ
jgi:predicted PurR-regulated permease PerM